MKKIIISLLLIMSLSSANIGESSYGEFKNIIYRNNIDLDSKSAKGWIRLFNSRGKIDDYGYSLTEEERLLMLSELRKINSKAQSKYKRGIE